MVLTHLKQIKMYRLLCIINRQNVVIKIFYKVLEGIRTAKIIEGKTSKIPHKTLEGIYQNIKHTHK